MLAEVNNTDAFGESGGDKSITGSSCALNKSSHFGFKGKKLDRFRGVTFLPSSITNRPPPVDPTPFEMPEVPADSPRLLGAADCEGLLICFVFPGMTSRRELVEQAINLQKTLVELVLKRELICKEISQLNEEVLMIKEYVASRPEIQDKLRNLGKSN